MLTIKKFTFNPFRLLLLYVLFFSIAFLFYNRAASAALSYDLLDFLLVYKQKGLSGFWTNFNDMSVRPFFHLNHLVLLKLFDLNYYGWNFVQVALHALNGLLVVIVCGRVSRYYAVNGVVEMSVIAGLLFLLSPYHTETVIWGCTIHYLTTTACILLAILSLFKLFEAENKYWAIMIHICFVIAIFSSEYALMLPLMLLVVYWLLLQKNGALRLRNFFWVAVIFPTILFVFFYFPIHKLILGKFVGHYGAGAHLNFSTDIIMFNAERYLLNYMVFLEYTSLNKQVLPFLYKDIAGISFLVFIMFYLWSIRKSLPLLTYTALFTLAILPVMNISLGLFYLKQADRYGYIALAFYSMGVAYLLYLFKGWIRYFFLLTYLIISCYFLSNQISDWRNAGEISSRLVDDYIAKYTEKDVFILGEAENYNGAYMFSTNYKSLDSSFYGFTPYYDLDKRLWLKTGKRQSKYIVHCIQFEMKDITDGVEIQKLSSDSFLVSTRGKQNIRFISNYMPVGEIPFHIADDSGKYELVNLGGGKCLIILTRKNSNQLLIYQSGDKWVAID